MLILVLLIASVLCLTLAALGIGGRIQLGWLGLALFVTTVLIPRL